MAKAENPGRDVLLRLAEIAGNNTEKECKKKKWDDLDKCCVEMKVAKDVTVSWLSTAIHPLQPLETVHQKAANEAVRGVKVEGKPDASDEQQDAQAEQLRNYFQSLSSDPQLMPENGNEPNDNSPMEMLKNAKEILKAIEESLEVSSAGEGTSADVTVKVKPSTLISDEVSTANINVTVTDSVTGKRVKDGTDVEIKLEEIYKGKGLSPCLVAGAAAPPPPPTGARDTELTTTTKKGSAKATLVSGGEADNGRFGKVVLSVQPEGTQPVRVMVYMVTEKENEEFAEATKDRIDKLIELLGRLYESFRACDKEGGDPKVYTPILDNVCELLAECRIKRSDIFKTIGPDTRGKIESLLKKEVGGLVKELERAVEGLAQIQMIFGIDGFYLFRLLVPFTIRADKRLTKNIKRTASGELTDLLNNDHKGRRDMEWIREWLKGKMVELDKALKRIDRADERLLFHLKGGRALHYVLGVPKEGTNDWDTGIVINPNLSAEEWYATLTQVHNVVLQQLRKAKLEFFVLLHKNAAKVRARLEEAASAGGAVTDEEQFDEYIEEVGNACKAELIDVGIPRRDSVEAIGHWHHVGPKEGNGGGSPSRIIAEESTDNVPIPPPYYFIDDIVSMIREALANVSPAPHKICKRVRRLHKVMVIDSGTSSGRALQSEIDLAKKQVGGGLFPESMGVINGLNEVFLQRMAPVLLRQFMQAYDLRVDGGLARVFDTHFKVETDSLDGIDSTYPQVIKDKIAKDDEWVDATHGKMLRWIAMADKLSGWRFKKSTMMEKHLEDRAAFFGFSTDPKTDRGDDSTKIPTTPAGRRGLLGSFIKALYTRSIMVQDGKIDSSIFKRKEKLEVQFAVCGSLAAYLHAYYAELDDELRRKMDPVSTVDLKIFCYQPSAKPDTVREALILPLLHDYVANPDNPQFEIQVGAKGAVYVYWPQGEAIGGFTAYRPLVVKISVATPGVWPQLAFVWGYPVLSIRDLVREYDHKAALTEEWGRKRKLKDTSLILKELLTRFDFMRKGEDLKFQV